MAGDLRNVPVKKRDVLWRIQGEIGLLIRKKRQAKHLTMRALAAKVDGLARSNLALMECSQMWGSKYYSALERELDLPQGYFTGQIQKVEPKAVHLAKASKAVGIIVGHELKRLRTQKGWSPEQLLDRARGIDSRAGHNVWTVESAEESSYWGEDTKQLYSIFAQALGQEPDYFEKLATQHLERLTKKDSSSKPVNLSQMLSDLLKAVGEPVQSITGPDEEGVWYVVTQSGKGYWLRIQIEPTED